MTAMPEYQVIARRFRPQKFTQVLGQSSIVTTLKNAIQRNRLATAYLFCGSRGTGKTTLARVFAKALNCANPAEDHEPCGSCPSCREIAQGNSLDVLEIDGASHRGIDDIRQINETVGYATACGKFKIYIIDEVHMLTKEAFNALLKTLEEPPPKVKFLFATTEPHKIPSTIVSRCQRFNLNRIPLDVIVTKLVRIAEELGITAEYEALRLIAKRAEGGLRDAESLLDQMIAYQDGALTASSVTEILGIMPREVLFSLDWAGKTGDYGKIFAVSEQLFSQGKDFVHFIEMLTEHIRTILLIKLGVPLPPSIVIQESEIKAYQAAAEHYSAEQCITILNLLVEGLSEVRFAPIPRFALESLLLTVLRTHNRIPIDFLIKRLAELEARSGQQHPISDLPPAASPASSNTPSSSSQRIAEIRTVEKEIRTAENSELPSVHREASEIFPQYHYDTLLQFAAVELEGTVQIKKINRQLLPST